MERAERKGWFKGLALGGVVGTLVGMSTLLPLVRTSSNQTLPEAMGLVKPEEKPTVSMIEERPWDGSYFQLNFYDRDLDRQTVERFESIKYNDFGTDVAGTSYNVERSEMSKEYAKRIDGLYQSYLRAEYTPGTGQVIENMWE